MLEAHTLVIRPCLSAVPGFGRAGDAVRVQEIADAETGQPQGYVYQTAPTSWWRRWLGPTVLAIHEADEEPLVCSLRRGWPLSATWEVCDADGNPLGLLHPPLFPRVRARQPLLLISSFPESVPGRDRGILAFLRPDDGVEFGGRFLDAQGGLLAQTDHSAAGHRLSYMARLEGEPILKMLLLAAVVSGGAG